MSIFQDLSILSVRVGFRKLLGVRLASQVGDGMFQAGLASLFFFNPQSMTTATGVASALVVMFLPYSLIGPFTGALLDRWRRRQVLMYGNMLRCILVMLIAVVMRIPETTGLVYALVLGTLGLSRFMLAGLSAGLPKVVAGKEQLLLANSIVPTLGGVATGIGAVLGVLMRLLLPDGQAKEAGSLMVAAGLYAGAAAVARMLAPDELGPDVGQMRAGGRSSSGISSGVATIFSTVRELVEAVTYLRHRGTPATALITMAAHRFVYYFQLIILILVSRNILADPSDADAGIGYFGTLGGAMVIGHFVAVVLTPIAHEKMAVWQWILVCLIGGSVGQSLLVGAVHTTVMIVGLFIFGIGVQGAKIAVDTIVQSDTSDVYRGRAFSIYDVLFNLAACVASGVAIVVLPDGGWSKNVQFALVLFVWIVALAFWRKMARLGGQARE